MDKEIQTFADIEIEKKKKKKKKEKITAIRFYLFKRCTYWESVSI